MRIQKSDWEKEQNSADEQIHVRRATRFTDRVLDALEWVEEIAAASMRTIGRAFVEGLAAYALGFHSCDPDLSRYPTRPGEMPTEMEDAMPEADFDRATRVLMT
jgi:hypothetical protein